jgi:RHS repeat-associated protein
MKKYTLTKALSLFGLILSGISLAQSTNENYVQSKTCLNDDCTRKSETITYFDGLGRAKQIISVKATPTGKDLVTPVTYDGFGRQVKNILPVPADTQNSNIHTGITNESTANSYYGVSTAYSEKEIENSPLDRVLQQANPGEEWKMSSGHTQKFKYEANLGSEVKKFVTNTSTSTANNVSTAVSTLSVSSDNSGYYPAGTLYKNTVTDEDGNPVIQFQNGRGQTLLIRRNDGTQNVDTYYVYNEYNGLAFVISPKAVKQIEQNNNVITDTILNELCYQYKYDGQDRQVEKKLPGKDWEFMVYDKQDRPVLTQDGVLRTTTNTFGSKGWIFTKYDEFGRVAYTGFYPNSDVRTAIQDQVNTITAGSLNNEIRVPNPIVLSGTNLYYRNLAFPSANIILLTANYYDTYPAEAPAVPTTVLGQYTLSQTLGSNDDASTKGSLTASYVKNIEDNNWTKTFNYYDSTGRLIATNTTNHLGGYTNTETELDFAGVPKLSKTYHKRLNTDTEKLITETFEYDDQNRLKLHKHKVGSNSEEILAQNTYNELSQLTNKKVGGIVASNPLQSIDYAYNIRGWMTKINDLANLNGKLFGYEIKYTNPIYTSLTSGKYNGNIAEVDWETSKDGILKRYSYQYDPLNRLKKGIYAEPNTSIPQNDYYNETLGYDMNGNITSLQRNRNAANIGAQLMDDLVYIYTGNQLNTVTDSSSNYFGYPDTSGTLIHYDLNGNMTDHVDKAILQINYNYLNLPNYIKFNKFITNRFGNSYFNTQYTYRADGVKLNKRYNYFSGRNNNATSSITDYLDGFQYTAEITGTVAGDPPMILQFVPTSEGYFDFVQNKYIYQYKDQVGNIRLAFFKDASGNPSIDRTTDFYPFGLEFGGDINISGSMSPNYTYNFQGQEKQQDTGWNSFKWRNYDPTMGRFFSVDPLAEKFPHNSTFAFQENMIGMGIELEGLELLPENTGYFAIRGNEMIVKQAPASQRDSFGRPTFTAADIGLSTKGYNPTAPRISSGETGLRLNSYNYSGAKAEDLSMESAETTSMGEQEVQTTGSNKLAEAKEKLATVADGVKELMNNAFMAMDIPAAIKSVDDHVKAAKDIKSVDFNATQMDLAIDYVNSSKIKMNQQTRNDVINYVYDGHLPNKGSMQNSGIISIGNKILKVNNAPIRPTAGQVKRMLNDKQKQIQNNLRNIPQ